MRLQLTPINLAALTIALLAIGFGSYFLEGAAMTAVVGAGTWLIGLLQQGPGMVPRSTLPPAPPTDSTGS